MIGLIYAPDTLLVFIEHNNGGEENTHMTSHNMIIFCGVEQGWQLLDSMSSQSLLSGCSGARNRSSRPNFGEMGIINYLVL